MNTKKTIAVAATAIALIAISFGTMNFMVHQSALAKYCQDYVNNNLTGWPKDVKVNVLTDCPPGVFNSTQHN